MTDEPIVRTEIIAPAIERIIEELPHNVRTAEVAGIIAAIVDAYGIDGDLAERLYLGLADRAQSIEAAKTTFQAMRNMRED